MTPQEFVQKWRKILADERTAATRLGERKLYQQHFLDLCALAGHQTPGELDPKQTFFSFEADAAKAGGGRGWADVWYKGRFAIEYKDVGRNLDDAYKQLLLYRDSLQNPPLLIVCNFEKLIIYPNFNNVQNVPVTLTLDDLLTPEGVQEVRALFYAPDYFRPDLRAIRVTEEAAGRFARLAEHLRKWGYAPHAIAHYLIRILFALFAEDIDLLPAGLVTRMVEAGKRNPGLFNRQIQHLFAAMATGDTFGEHPIRYFNGGLFDDAAVLELDADALVLLDQVTVLDWSAMEPAILGTLFTRGLDPGQRAKLGAQYTSRADILLIVEPVLMGPLRREWAAVQEQVRGLAERRQAAGNQKERVQAQKEIEKRIDGFFERLVNVTVLDPACGSGNFLYVALMLLLDLWLEVRNFAGEMGLSMRLPLEGLAPHPRQLYGIEINEYAHELASTTVWIGYLQWLHQHGFGFMDDPVLEPLENIKQMDAILAYDGEGKPVEPEWPRADVIVGNPPFLGDKKMNSVLGTAYVAAVRQLYEGRIPGQSDLVCYWFERARALIETKRVQRVGLLATQAIRGGSNRTVLDRITATGCIFWAQSDRKWILDDVAVHVSMIGFDDGAELSRQLDGQMVSIINSDLTSNVDLTKAHILPENASLAFIGPSPHGPFDVDQATATALRLDYINSNGRPNSDVVRPVFSSVDIGQGWRRKYTIDFALMPYEEANQYALPFAYVQANIHSARTKNKSASNTTNWWQYERPRPDMRAALKGLPRFIATQRVSKHRLFVWLPAEALANDGTTVVARSDDYFFGVLHSRIHELWARGKGTQLREAESGFRYTPTTTFETFPFPWPPGREPQDDPRVQAIAEAARELVALREGWLNPPDVFGAELEKRTLTNLYNQRPGWLAEAHARLDAAVLAAYGWPAGLEDEEVLARLLALNLARAGR